MLMGLMNAAAMFMQTMNNLFSNILDSGMAIFLDDILVYLCIVKKHFTLLEKVLVHLCQHIFFYKLKKSSFLYKNTIFLGFAITPESMCISYSKVWSLNK